MDDEEFIEVPTEEYDSSEEFTMGDIVFITFGAVLLCGIVAFICSQIRKTFKDVHLKVGNKFEIGVNPKE